MKQELINKINPNCLLPFSYMVLWIDNLTFLNDSNGALKLEVKNKIRSDGRLEQDGWDILIHNVVFEDFAPVNGNTILNWIMLQGAPTCNQLKIIIQSLKLGGLAQLYVEYPVLDILEIDMKTKPLSYDRRGNITNNGGKTLNYYTGQGIAYGKIEDGGGILPDNPDGPNLESVKYHVRFLTLYIKNFEYIKDCNPYLVIERYSGASNGKNRKSGWKRDKVLNQLNARYPLWGGGSRLITYTDGYRPNNIPITSAQQDFDIFAENYIKIGSMDSYTPQGVGMNYDRNVRRQNNGLSAKVSLRLRIGIKSGGREFLSKPLLNFTIFAQQLSGGSNEPVFVGFSKL